MVDTCVLIAGVAGLKDPSVPTTPSALFLREWIEQDTFTWLVTPEILDEYTEVLARLGVRTMPSSSPSPASCPCRS